jgi:hypothetical protein
MESLSELIKKRQKDPKPEPSESKMDDSYLDMSMEEGHVKSLAKSKEQGGGGGAGIELPPKSLNHTLFDTSSC